jgi:thioredoxin-like negative regulator of GroEL
MEELWGLRKALEAGDVQAALTLVDEMEEMSRDDKVQKIASYMRVLLVHKIKQAVEGRSTKSSDVSIRHALRQIAAVNKRREAGGWYLNDDE